MLFWILGPYVLRMGGVDFYWYVWLKIHVILRILRIMATLVMNKKWWVEIPFFHDLEIENYAINRQTSDIVLRFYWMVLTVVCLHFSLYTAIATIKVHLEATGALCLVTLLAHKRVCVHCIKEYLAFWCNLHFINLCLSWIAFQWV